MGCYKKSASFCGTEPQMQTNQISAPAKKPATKQSNTSSFQVLWPHFMPLRRKKSAAVSMPMSVKLPVTCVVRTIAPLKKVVIAFWAPMA